MPAAWRQARGPTPGLDTRDLLSLEAERVLRMAIAQPPDTTAGRLQAVALVCVAEWAALLARHWSELTPEEARDSDARAAWAAPYVTVAGGSPLPAVAELRASLGPAATPAEFRAEISRVLQAAADPLAHAIKGAPSTDESPAADARPARNFT